MSTATAEAPPAQAPASFSVAARERFTGAFKDQTLTLLGSSQTYDLTDLAAGDFTAGVYLLMTGTAAGNSASVAYQADGPFSCLQQVELLDPSGQAFQTYSGYELFIIDMLGGYTGQGDATKSPYYTAVTGSSGTAGSFSFILRIPCEVAPRDGIGALFNGSTAAQFKVRVTLAASTAIYTVAPTVLPGVRMRVVTHGYKLPGSLPSGRPFADRPPGGATYQCWNRQPWLTIGAGNNLVPMNRKAGALYRQVIVILRNSSGVRIDTLAAGDIKLHIDGVDHYLGPYELIRHVTWERNRQQNGLTDLPIGVLQFSWCHDWDGLTGGETRDWYVPVAPGSIVEYSMVGSGAGQAIILVNDVLPAPEAITEGVVQL